MPADQKTVMAGPCPCHPAPAQPPVPPAQPETPRPEQPPTNSYANHNSAREGEGIMNHVRGMVNGDDEEGTNGRRPEAFAEPAPPQL